jgi:hypothetical protein
MERMDLAFRNVGVWEREGVEAWECGRHPQFWRVMQIVVTRQVRRHTSCPCRKTGGRRVGGCKGAVVFHFVAFYFVISDCCGAVCSSEGNCFERANNTW